MNDKKKKYSLAIIGTGPAGLTASIYASRYKIDHVIIGESIGGLAFSAHKICNFPSIKEISGVDLMSRMKDQVEALGSPLLQDKVVDISEKGGGFKINTQGEKEFWANTILLASGTEHRKMNLPDEEHYIGKGVSYCATCDAMFYRDKTVAVVGGSDSANTTALYLADIAKKVYQIYRGDKLRGETVWINNIENNEKIEVIYNTEIVDLKGDGKLEKIILNKPYKDNKEIMLDGVFVEIGTIPQRVLVKKLSLDINEKKYIKVGQDQRTSEKGVWAAGDITTGSNNFHQIVTACSEGAIAAENIFKFLQKRK